MSLVDTREIATAKIVMLGGTGGSNVEGNPTGSATEYLSKLQIDDTIFETAGVIPFDVTLINNSDIHISAVNAGQLDGKTILINTTTHTGTTPAGWFLKINQSTSYEMITPEGRSFKDAVSDNMAMIVRLDASQAEATVLGVLGSESSDVVSGLGIGKKTSVSNNVIITDIDLHRAPMAGDRLLIWFDTTVQNPTGLTTYNNGTAVTSNLENVSPLYYNAGWNIVQFMNDGLLYNNVWVRKQNVPLPINTLSGLSDTAIASPSDGQLLTFDNDSQKWKNKTYVEANTGFPVTELKKLKVGNVVYDTDGMKNYSVTNVASNNITVSVLNSNQFVQEVIAINTGAHTGSSSAWNLVLTDGMNPVSVALKNVDGTAFADDINANELLFIYVDTAGNTAQVLEIHSHDLEILKDAIITEKTVSGNPITVTDALPYPAVSVSAEIEAIQDLHGYDKPWVGGAGKNLCPMTLADIKSRNTIGTWSGNKYTLNDLSFEVLTDSVDNVTGIKADGTPSANTSFYINGHVSLASDSYIASVSGSSVPSGVYISLRGTGISKDLYGNTVSQTFSISSNVTDFVAYIFVSSGTVLSNYTIQLLLRLSSVSDPTFAPWENICPISGRTSVTITDVDAESQTATVTVQLGQTVYGGSLNLTTGVMTVTKAKCKISDLEWSTQTSAHANFTSSSKSNEIVKTNTDIVVLSDTYVACSNSTSVANRSQIYANANGDIKINDTRYSTVAEFTTAMGNSEIVYNLATPTTIQLTPTQLTMLKGYNLLSSDGGGDITLTYKADRLAAIEAALAAL